MILQEPLVKCPALAVGAPVSNDSAHISTFKRAALNRGPWTQDHPPQLGHTFISSLYKQSLVTLHYTPQLQKLLENEGDVGDVMLTNVLFPVALMLNKLIAPRYRQFFVVGIQHQSSFTPPGSQKSIFIDHAIVLLDRRGFSSSSLKISNPKSVSQRKRVYLLIVEEKRAGYVQPAGWNLSFEEQNAKTLMPQGLMYAKLLGCQRILFSDYERGVALHIVEKTPFVRKASFTVASHECYNPRGGAFEPVDALQDPLNLGLRSSTAYLGFCALNELGVLNYDLIDVPPSLRAARLDERLVHIINLPPPPPDQSPHATQRKAQFTFAPQPPRQQPKRSVKQAPNSRSAGPVRR